MKNLTRLSIFILALATSARINAQIVTNTAAPYNNATFLVNNVLMDNSMQGYNISSYGAQTQMGFFSNGMTAIGMDSGLVMTSGSVAQVMGNSFSFANTMIANGANQGGGDADLLSVAQSVPPLIGQFFNVFSTLDACIINFDFVPSSDTVEFNYVFGSDEYLGWVNSSFNDVFGFFLSGPGINGPYSNNAINVANVPNTSPALPITISTIHPGLNGVYYNAGNAFMAYNGYTDVMTAVLEVQACDTFHMKLGIADGSDKILDTGVFLEAGSFVNTGIIVDPSPSYNPYGADTALYEGCGDVNIYFTRSDSALLQDTLKYEVWGQAEMQPFNGVGGDFSHIVNSLGNPCIYNAISGHWECELVFAAGAATDSITFEVFYDNINEGIESLVIAVTDSVELGCMDGDTIYLSVLDQPELQISAFGDVTLDCNDDPALIGVEVFQGLPPFSFQWDNNETDSTQYVMPAITTTYVVTVNDACGDQSEVDFVNVGIFNVPWSTTKIGDNQTMSCVDPPVTLAVGVMFNDNIWHGDISYQWSTGSTDSLINVQTTVDTSYTVTITRNCTGESVTRTFNVYAYNDPVETETKDIPETYFDCPGDTATIRVIASGGYEPYSYTWSNGATTSSTVVDPLLTETYTVTVHDVCGLVDYIDEVVVNVPVPDPLEIFGVVNDTIACRNQKAHFGPALPKGGFGWGYTFSWDNFKTIGNYTQAVLYADSTFTIWLTDGCRTDTVSKTVEAVIAKRSNLKLIMPNDTLICYDDILLLHPEVTGGADDFDYSYAWSSGQSSESIKITGGIPMTYSLRVTDECDTVRYGEVFVDVARIDAAFDYEYLNDYDVAFTNQTKSSHEIVGYAWESEAAGVASFEASPVIPYPDGQSYETMLTATDIHGCIDTTSMIIAPSFHLYIPNGFTPNNDNVNDEWYIKSTGIRELRVEIYNRWGETLFSTSDKNFRWDGTFEGKRVPMGTYTYRIVLFTDNDEYIERRGSLSVLNDFQNRND